MTIELNSRLYFPKYYHSSFYSVPQAVKEEKKKTCRNISSVQFNSVTQSCPTLCDPMNCSTPGLPVYHQLLESTQTHVHWVSDAIQPSYPLSSPSPPAFNLSQHRGLFRWVSSSHQVFANYWSPLDQSILVRFNREV